MAAQDRQETFIIARRSGLALSVFLFLAVAWKRYKKDRPWLLTALQRIRSFGQLLRTRSPVWPPPPAVLFRQVPVFAAVGGLCLCLIFVGSRVGGERRRDEEESRAWIAHERKQRSGAVQSLLEQLPLERLCLQVPGLEHFLGKEPGVETGVAGPAGEPQQAGGLSKQEEAEFPVTVETLAEATEKLAKVQREDPVVARGYAVASALAALSLRPACSNQTHAPPSPAPSPLPSPLRGDLPDKLSASQLEPESGWTEAEAEGLQVSLTAAQELESRVWLHCSRAEARRILRLSRAESCRARVLLRHHRGGQWRSVLQLLCRFRSTLPFLLLSLAFSGVLGAFSAMRLHYQAAVINLAKDVFGGPRSANSQSPLLGRNPTDPGATSSVGEAVGAMLLSEAISQLAAFVRARFSLLGKSRAVQELKVALFQALLHQDLEYLEQADLWQLRHLIGNCGTIVGQIVDFPTVVVEAFVRLFAAVLALWQKNARMACFLAVLLPTRFLLEQALEFLGDYAEQCSCLPDFRGQINACWSTLVRPASLRTLRAFAREPLEVASFARFLGAHDRLQERGALVYRLLQPFRAFLEHGVDIAALWYGGRLAVRGELDFGDLSSVVLVGQQAFDGARYAYSAAAGLSVHAVPPLARMARLLAQQPRIGLDWPASASGETKTALEALEARAVRWRITFLDVSFAYPQRPGALVLQGLSFTAEAGEFLGLLGSTGAGKSTIFALLLRFYDPTSGRILLDGKDLRSYSPLWLRRHIGFVSQDLVLCHRTIHENLIYGCSGEGLGSPPALADEEARHILNVAQCEDTFFNAAVFPALWHTDVGEGGCNLSGGERQRLAIARAIAKKPRLLLLDEASSALDEISQAKLQTSLEAWCKQEEVTVICIAHRLSNFARADRLVVLSGGKAVEEGTPAALLAISGGHFAEYAQTHHESVPSLVPGTTSS